MKNTLFQDPLYAQLDEAQADWAVWAWNTVLTFRGILPTDGFLPSEAAIQSIRNVAPNIMKGSPQEDAGYILMGVLEMYS